MPTYDYVCNGCGERLEIFQSMRESPKKKCPACGALKLRREIGTGAGIIFKGSGFYQTDYRSESYKKGAQADGPPKESESSKSPESDGGSKSSKKDSTPKKTDGGD